MLSLYKKPDKYIVLSSLQIIYLILNKSAKNRNKKYFSYQYNREIFRIKINSILYFESNKRKVMIHRVDGKVLEYYGKLDDVEKEVHINGKKNSKQYLTPQKIDEINQLLQTPEFIYDQKIKLEQFAQRVAVNSTYLNRYFNQEYGCSFLQYLTSLRIEQAEMLLRDSNAEIEDICYNTGFNSPSAFHKAFKNRYGYSPSEWRRRCLT